MSDADFLLEVLSDQDPDPSTESRAVIAALRTATTQPPDHVPHIVQRGGGEYAEYLRRKIGWRVSVDANGCWVWQGCRNKRGYGVMGAFRNKGASAPRVSYAVFVDETPLPADWSIDHLCRNRACVCPWHLEAVPHAENV